jgi:hypothetical protein
MKRSKNILLVMSAVLTAATVNTSLAQFEWARRVAKSDQTDMELAMGFALDSAGNSYVCGWFDGMNDFGGTTLTSYGGEDIFVAKYNSAGALQWARQAGGATADWDVGRAVGVDGAGNCYLAGGFFGTATFGNTTRTSVQDEDFFLMKYDSQGAFQWVRQAGSAAYGAYGTGMAVDNSGNCYVVGYFDGDSITFGSTTLVNLGEYSVFVVKYNNSGTLLWAKSIGGSGSASAYSTRIALDNDGNCYVVGNFNNTVSLGTASLISAGGNDFFLAKYSSAGDFQWAQRAGGTGKEDGGGVAVDQANNIYVTGLFSGTSSFGTTNLTSAGSWDVFVAKYTSAGMVQWVRSAGGPSSDAGSGLALDGAGNCIITGVFATNAFFGTNLLTSAGGWDIVVAKYSPDGVVQWAQRAGGTNDEIGFGGFAIDAVNSCYVAGWFQGASVFGTNTLQAQGYLDVFLAKLAEPLAAAPTLGIAWSNSVPQLSVGGSIGGRYALDYAGSLSSAVNWQRLVTNTLLTNPQQFTDTTAAGITQRFYRARVVP